MVETSKTGQGRIHASTQSFSTSCLRISNTSFPRVDKAPFARSTIPTQLSEFGQGVQQPAVIGIADWRRWVVVPARIIVQLVLFVPAEIVNEAANWQSKRQAKIGFSNNSICL